MLAEEYGKTYAIFMPLPERQLTKSGYPDEWIAALLLSIRLR